MTEEMKEARNIVLGKQKFTLEFVQFDRIYPFTNENMASLMNCDSVTSSIKNKEILTVCSSGDQAFHFLLQKPKKLELFDVNLYTKYYFDLKRAMILEKNIRDFYLFFFTNSGHWTLKKQYQMFQEVQTSLEEDTICFFERVFHTILELNNDQASLFHGNGLFYSDSSNQIANIPYLKKENYYKLRKQLEKREILFHPLEILNDDLTSLANYDLIYLSNICDYVRYYPNYQSQSLGQKDFPEEVLKYQFYQYRHFLTQILGKHLNQDGKIVQLKLAKWSSFFANEKLWKEIFKEEEGFSKEKLEDQETSDEVIVYQKRK